MDRIEGVSNVRDVGGMPLQGGGRIASGVLYRSAGLDRVTPTGEAELAASTIGTVVDMRTSAERTNAPDVLPTTRELRLVALPLLEGAMTGAARSGGNATAALMKQAVDALPALPELYVSMLESGADTFAEIARLIGTPHDPQAPAVLIHCTAGKDRTGVATALMLSAVGAEREAIIADYASSAANLAGPWADRTLAAVASMGIEITPKITDLLTGTPPIAITTALDWVDEHYGDAAAYLRSGGLTDAELESLRAALRA